MPKGREGREGDTEVLNRLPNNLLLGVFSRYSSFPFSSNNITKFQFKLLTICGKMTARRAEPGNEVESAQVSLAIKKPRWRPFEQIISNRCLNPHFSRSHDAMCTLDLQSVKVCSTCCNKHAVTTSWLH